MLSPCLIYVSNGHCWFHSSLCRFFQQMLDDSMACIRLNLRHSGDGQLAAKTILKRAHYVQCMKTVVIYVPAATTYCLLQNLPDHITTLTVYGIHISAKHLTRLPCLTALCASIESNGASYFRHVTGLTRLHYDRNW